ncbi:MAG: prolyl oligopeptidase family serine peptidase [Acidobacteriia bacterium]|nr:prolyl oligopeptidase family serine peptidase [Terriglobia bacterium]
MRNPRHALILLLAALGCFGIAELAIAQGNQQSKTTEVSASPSSEAERYSDGLRKWAPPDSVAVRYFLDDYWDKLRASPDGTKFFIVSFHGDLSCDCDVYELSVFATEDVRQALARTGSTQGTPPQPLRRLIRRSSGHPGHYTFAISSARWEPDGESVSFQGTSEQGINQLYLFNVRSGTVTALTNWRYDVGDISRFEGGTIISEVNAPALVAPPVYPVHAITPTELKWADVPASERKRKAIFVAYRGGAPRELETAGMDLIIKPFFSADGRRAVWVGSPNGVPASWAAYDQLSGLSVSDGVEATGVSRFMMFDPEHGHVDPVFDAPFGMATKMGQNLYPYALWAEDQKHVVLVNTALPLMPGKDPDRARTAYVVGFNADTGQWTVIEPLESHDGADGVLRRVTNVAWMKTGKELLIRHEVAGKPSPGTVYALEGDRWVGHTVDATVKVNNEWWEPPKPALTSGLSVTLKQSANDPPMMVASDGHHELALTSPDPALEGVWWARQEPFQWREPSGKIETGGLLLPREQKGPVPLVIQAYTYDPKEFAPDGPATHAYAAQSLVARGMVVLNVNIPGEDSPRIDGPRELTEFLERVESAADALANRGLIDRARVGLIGFSRAGFDIRYAITHPGKIPAAAAVIDDGFHGTYSSYLSHGDQWRAEYEGLYGGSFWKNKATWLEHENSFNVDRVETPALFAVHRESSVSNAAEDIGAFALNHRPLEYLVYPEGTHQLHMPRQRLASYDASVDWMSFWLQGKAPADPERAARWTAMKTAWVQTQTEESERKKPTADSPPHN